MNWSMTGYSCPNCGRLSCDATRVSMTKPKILKGHETYSWREKHQCETCSTIYYFKNGT